MPIDPTATIRLSGVGSIYSMTSKDQRYTQKKRKLSHKGEITDRQITLRVGEEELVVAKKSNR